MIDLTAPVNKVHWKENLASFNAGFQALQDEYNRAYSSFDDKPTSSTLPNDWLRISALGKPLVVQAMNSPAGVSYLLENPHTTECISEKVQLIFILGHFLEMWALDFLTRQGWAVTAQQQEVVLHGVLGHIDAVICKNGHSFVVDVKSMNARYYERMQRSGVDDSRGYLTQLACYSMCLNIPPVMLCVNKNTAEVMVLEVNAEALESVQSNIESRIKTLRNVKTWEDICALPRPPLEPEVFKKQHTGRFKLHESVTYWEYRHLFWDIIVEKNGYGKPTEYVVGVKNET